MIIIDYSLRLTIIFTHSKRTRYLSLLYKGGPLPKARPVNEDSSSLKIRSNMELNQIKVKKTSSTGERLFNSLQKRLLVVRWMIIREAPTLKWARASSSNASLDRTRPTDCSNEISMTKCLAMRPPWWKEKCWCATCVMRWNFPWQPTLLWALLILSWLQKTKVLKCLRKVLQLATSMLMFYIPSKSSQTQIRSN